MTHANNKFEEKGRQSKLSTTDINEKAKWISARVPRALKIELDLLGTFKTMSLLLLFLLKLPNMDHW